MATLQEQWAQKQERAARERPPAAEPATAVDPPMRLPARDAVDPGVIGARVRALREASDLSLRDLAARSGVSAPMLSQVERGETSPTLTLAA
jgi:ribosome-binding protein aMBF1 (putative translation factor)